MDAAFIIILGSLILTLVVLAYAGLWQTFKKAGRPGWAGIVPIYQTWVLAEIGDRPGWWGLIAALGGGQFSSSANQTHSERIFWLAVFLISLVFNALICLRVAQKFDKSTWFALLLVFLPFIGFPILGFGSAQYQGKEGSATVAVKKKTIVKKKKTAKK